MSLRETMSYLLDASKGDCFFVRILNGCDKVFGPHKAMAYVMLDPVSRRWTLGIDPEQFDVAPLSMQRGVLIHEAGHIILRHVERALDIRKDLVDEDTVRAFNALCNIAQDLAVNDSIVRNECGKEEWQKQLCFPENYTPPFPSKLSFEEYLLLYASRMKGPKNEQGGNDSKRSSASNEKGDFDSIGNTNPGNSDSSSGSSKPSDSSDSTSSDDNEDSPSPQPETLKDRIIKELTRIGKTMRKEIDKMLAEGKCSGHQDLEDLIKGLSPSEINKLIKQAKYHGKHLVGEAQKQSFSGPNRGLMPGYLKQLVDGMLQDTVIPWDSLLKDILCSSVASKIVDVMLPNQTMLGTNYSPYPGQTLDMRFRIWWLQDTSGSMSDDEFKRANKCLVDLANSNNSVELIQLQGDALCQHEFSADTDRLGNEELDQLRERFGYGGTSYTSMFKRILGVDDASDWQDPALRPESNPGQADLVVVYTDGGVGIEGECFPQYKPTCPIIWLVAPGCESVAGMDNKDGSVVIKMFEQA